MRYEDFTSAPNTLRANGACGFRGREADAVPGFSRCQEIPVRVNNTAGPGDLRTGARFYLEAARRGVPSMSLLHDDEPALTLAVRRLDSVEVDTGTQVLPSVIETIDSDRMRARP